MVGVMEVTPGKRVFRMSRGDAHRRRRRVVGLFARVASILVQMF